MLKSKSLLDLTGKRLISHFRKRQTNELFNSSKRLIHDRTVKKMAWGNKEIEKKVQELDKKIDKILKDLGKENFREQKELERHKKSNNLSIQFKSVNNFSKITSQDGEKPQEISVKTAITLPLEVMEQLRKEDNYPKLKEDYNTEKKLYRYNEIYPLNMPVSAWEIGKSKVKELPSKLYDTQVDEDLRSFNFNEAKNNVVEIERKDEVDEVESYAILSYVWGGKKEPGEVLSAGGKKALLKAIATCNKLRIRWLWMDQLCINQDNPPEKFQEVAKMKQYYGNSVVTLVAIQGSATEKSANTELNLDSTKILSLILKSEWFERSWTFQEGFLSKQTLFMFDDCLIDGRWIARRWVTYQRSHTGDAFFTSPDELNEGLTKIATPVGWVYYKDGYSYNDTVHLNLWQVLEEARERKRTEDVDKIYSMLGLLPYGHLVKVDYSMNQQQALSNVIKVAMENGYWDMFTWHGLGSIPPNVEDVVGGVNTERCLIDKNKVKIMEDGVKVKGLKHIDIENVYENVYEWEKYSSRVSRGLYEREVGVKLIIKGKNKHKKISLRGTKETLDIINKDHYLLIDKSWINSNKSFALVISWDEDKFNTFSRVGLVELYRKDAERLEEGGGKIDLFFSFFADNTSKEQSEKSCLEKELEKMVSNMKNELNCNSHATLKNFLLLSDFQSKFGNKSNPILKQVLEKEKQKIMKELFKNEQVSEEKLEKICRKQIEVSESQNKLDSFNNEKQFENQVEIDPYQK